jgi:hypothetical protein
MILPHPTPLPFLPPFPPPTCAFLSFSSLPSFLPPVLSHSPSPPVPLRCQFIRSVRSLTIEAVEAVDTAVDKVSAKASTIFLQQTRDPSQPWNFKIPELVVTFRHCDYALLDCALGLPNVAKECLCVLRADPPPIVDFRFTLNPEDLRNIYSCRANVSMAPPIAPRVAVQMLAYFLFQLPEVWTADW